MLVLFSVTLITDMDPDLMGCAEVFGAVATLVLYLTAMHLVEMLEVLTPQNRLEVGTDPTFAIMKVAHLLPKRKKNPS